MREDVYDKLRESIIRGRLRAGERLRVSMLASDLHVSRTPVREALRRLEDEGLVETAASRWTRVAAGGLPQAQRLYAIVSALESMAVCSGEFTSVEIAALRRANLRVAAAVERDGAHAAYVADCDFHDIIVAHASNAELTRIITDLRVKMRLIEYTLFNGKGAASASIGEHDAILECIISANLQGAAGAISENHRSGLVRLAQGQRDGLSATDPLEPDVLSDIGRDDRVARPA